MRPVPACPTGLTLETLGQPLVMEKAKETKKQNMNNELCLLLMNIFKRLFL